MQMSVSDSMSEKLITVHPGESLQLAYDKMQRRDLHHLLVVDERGALVGIVSSDDLTRAIFGHASAGSHQHLSHIYIASSVRDVMNPTLSIVSPRATLREAAQQMTEDKCSALVVIDNNQVLGLLTQDDLLHATLLNEDATVGGAAGDLQKVEAMLYNSPLSGVVDFLNNSGL